MEDEHYLDHKDYESIGITQTHELYKKKIQNLKDSLIKYKEDYIFIDDIINEIEEHLEK